jgi:hypothetical protein
MGSRCGRGHRGPRHAPARLVPIRPVGNWSRRPAAVCLGDDARPLIFTVATCQCLTLASHLSMSTSWAVLRRAVLRLLHESGCPSSRFSRRDYEHHTRGWSHQYRSIETGSAFPKVLVCDADPGIEALPVERLLLVQPPDEDTQGTEDRRAAWREIPFGSSDVDALKRRVR